MPADLAQPTNGYHCNLVQILVCQAQHVLEQAMMDPRLALAPLLPHQARYGNFTMLINNTYPALCQACL